MSSTTSAHRPSAPAHTPAATPAGPPPTISTSNISSSLTSRLRPSSRAILSGVGSVTAMASDGNPQWLHNRSEKSIAMMRLRLVHTLSLVLVVFVFTALVAFGGLLAWNLHRGFASYLVARDTDQLERFAAVVADYIGQDGGMALRNHRLDFGKILDEFALREGLPRARPPDPAGMPPEGPLPDGPREFPAPESFAGRLSVHDPAGNLLAGPPLASSAPGVTRRPIVVGGSVVATVSLRPAPPVPSSVETDFLRHQFIGITLLTACLLGFSLVAARALAGWLA